MLAAVLKYFESCLTFTQPEGLQLALNCILSHFTASPTQIGMLVHAERVVWCFNSEYIHMPYTQLSQLHIYIFIFVVTVPFVHMIEKYPFSENLFPFA
jgi:hypothetical protein